MALTTFGPDGRTWHYVKNVGRQALVGQGFTIPTALTCDGDRIYVLSRGGEQFGGKRVTVLTVDDERFLFEFSRTEDWRSELLVWPSGMCRDSEGNVFVTEEWFSYVWVFDREGTALYVWSMPGDGPGQIQFPSSVCCDRDDNIWVVCSRNGRIQRFNRMGEFINGFSFSHPQHGKLNLPAGLTVDDARHLYVVDWGNHRVLKFDYTGNLLMTFGREGKGLNSLHHPMDVAVDPDGDVYVADTMANRVVVFDPEGAQIAVLTGDATDFSDWALESLDANPDFQAAFRRAPAAEQQMRAFKFPMGCTFDPQRKRLYVCDTARSRIQIYEKERDYEDAAWTL